MMRPIRTRTRLALAVATALALPGMALPASAQVVADTFDIVYADTVSPGVPGPGAGDLETAGATDVYRFEGTAGDAAILDVDGSAGMFRWTLEAPSGAVVWDRAWVDTATDLPESGIYQLTVRGAQPTSTGTYSFRLLLTPPVEEFALALGDTVSTGVPGPGAGDIEVPGAVDRYVFEATTARSVVLDTLSGPTSGLRWILQAPDGTELFNAIYTDRELVLPAAGDYVLTVSGLTIAGTGGYSFLLSAGPEPETFDIAIGDTVYDGVPEPGAGNLEAPGAVDRYRIEGTAGQVVTFDALSGSTNDVRWRLEAPDGSVLFDVFYVDQQVALSASGTYVLTVDGQGVTGFGTYSFELVGVPPRVDEFTIAIGDTVSDGIPGPGAGNIEGPGALDVYAFDAAAGQTVALDVSSVPTTGLRATLQAPDGSEAFSGILADREVTLDAGTHRLTVSGLTVTGEGTYAFHLVDVPPNGVPTAVDDEVETPFETSVEVDVLANDSDPDGDVLSVVEVGDPSDGSVSTDGVAVTYVPEPGFEGVDAFTYMVGDGRGGSAEATVTVTVLAAPNRVPMAVDDEVETPFETSVEVDVLANDSDPDGDVLSVVEVGDPSDGSVSTDGVAVTYVPEPGFEGVDVFTYMVGDGRGGSAEATVTVTVLAAPNATPTIVDIPDQEATVGDVISLAVVADDADGDSLVHASTGLPPGLAMDSGSGAITGTVADGADDDSPHEVTVTVTDPHGATASTTFTWVVHPVDDETLAVDVDILLPCLFVNGIGVIPVLVHGSPRLDVRQVDVATVRLEEMPVKRLFSRYLAVISDVDQDGHDDLVVLIEDRTSGDAPVPTTATLTGSLRDGTLIQGSDRTCTRP